MRNIRILLLSAVLIIASLSSIEAKKVKKDAYRQKVEQLLLGDNDTEEFQTKLKEAVSQKEGTADANELKKLEKYMSEEFFNDYVEMMDNALRPSLTLDELDEIIAFQHADSTKLLAEKARDFAKKLQDPNSDALRPMMDMVQGMVAFLSGQDTTATEESVDPIFHAYYNASGTDKIMESYMGNIIGSIFGQFDDPEKNAESRLALLGKMTRYFSDNLEPTVMKMMDGIYNQQDYEYYTRNMATPTYQKYVAAAANADLGGFVLNILSKLK